MPCTICGKRVSKKFQIPLCIKCNKDDNVTINKGNINTHFLLTPAEINQSDIKPTTVSGRRYLIRDVEKVAENIFNNQLIDKRKQKYLAEKEKRDRKKTIDDYLQSFNDKHEIYIWLKSKYKNDIMKYITGTCENDLFGSIKRDYETYVRNMAEKQERIKKIDQYIMNTQSSDFHNKIKNMVCYKNYVENNTNYDECIKTINWFVGTEITRINKRNEKIARVNSKLKDNNFNDSEIEKVIKCNEYHDYINSYEDEKKTAELLETFIRKATNIINIDRDILARQNKINEALQGKEIRHNMNDMIKFYTDGGMEYVNFVYMYEYKNELTFEKMIDVITS